MGEYSYLSRYSFPVIIQIQFLLFAILVLHVDLFTVRRVSELDFNVGSLPKSEEALRKESGGTNVNESEKECCKVQL